MGLEVVLKIALGISEEEFKRIVRNADNGKKAVDICTKGMPDLIFMDINMPVMGGFEATKKIK
jgi:CheY-like chemotaxis protein